MRHLLTLTLILAAAPAAANDAIDACRAAHGGDPAAHIECLEAALRGTETSPPAGSTAVAPWTAPVLAPIPATAPPAAVAAPPAPRPEAAAPTGLGAEQVTAAQRQADATEGPMTVRIVSATYNARELGTFRLDNGQVWRETMKSPPHRRLSPDTEYTARIERGSVGGYRMRVDGIKWMKRVERLE